MIQKGKLYDPLNQFVQEIGSNDPCTHHKNKQAKIKQKHKLVKLQTRMIRSSTIAVTTSSVAVSHTQRLCSHSLPINYRSSFSPRNPSVFLKWKRNIASSNTNRFRMATKALAQPLQNADELIDSVETFIFDCDGMLC